MEVSDIYVEKLCVHVDIVSHNKMFLAFVFTNIVDQTLPYVRSP